MLVPGHVMMGLCHILIGTFAFLKISTAAFIFIMLFLVIYQISNGTVVWLYCSEIAGDRALGICVFVLWSVILLLTLTSNFLMHSAL